MKVEIIEKIAAGLRKAGGDKPLLIVTTDYKYSEDNEYFDVVPTLSVAEMLEILPKKINKGNDYYLVIFALKKGYGIQYLSVYNGVMQAGKADTNGILLRDALFEMIKLLKQNKFI